MAYIIERTDGAYVAPPGQASSYTTRLQSAWAFATRAAAERECCPENERVRDTNDIMQIDR